MFNWSTNCYTKAFNLISIMLLGSNLSWGILTVFIYRFSLMSSQVIDVTHLRDQIYYLFNWRQTNVLLVQKAGNIVARHTQWPFGRVITDSLKRLFTFSLNFTIKKFNRKEPRKKVMKIAELNGQERKRIFYWKFVIFKFQYYNGF